MASVLLLSEQSAEQACEPTFPRHAVCQNSTLARAGATVAIKQIHRFKRHEYANKSRWRKSEPRVGTRFGGGLAG
jgi:hypothetical protein